MDPSAGIPLGVKSRARLSSFPFLLPMEDETLLELRGWKWCVGREKQEFLAVDTSGCVRKGKAGKIRWKEGRGSWVHPQQAGVVDAEGPLVCGMFWKQAE